MQIKASRSKTKCSTFKVGTVDRAMLDWLNGEPASEAEDDSDDVGITQLTCIGILEGYYLEA